MPGIKHSLQWKWKTLVYSQKWWQKNQCPHGKGYNKHCYESAVNKYTDNRSQIISAPLPNTYWFHTRNLHVGSISINFLTNSSVSSGTRWLLGVTPADIALRIAASILDLSDVTGMCVFSSSVATPDSNSEVWSDGTTSGASVSDSCKEHKKTHS